MLADRGIVRVRGSATYVKTANYVSEGRERVQGVCHTIQPITANPTRQPSPGIHTQEHHYAGGGERDCHSGRQPNLSVVEGHRA